MMEARIAKVAAELWAQEVSPQTLHLLKRNLLDSYAGICASLLDKGMVAAMGRYAAMVPDQNGLMVWGVGRRA